MKKFLLLGVLTLTIVTSMVAGTLASYTKTLAPIEDTVTAKIFDISADANAMENVDVRIAPNENADWSFKVRNYEDISLPTEVKMTFGTSIKIPTAFVNQGVSVTMKIDGVNATLVSSTDGANTFYTFVDNSLFAANVAKELNCVINFNWDNFSGTQADTEAIENLKQDFSVTVTGTQTKN